jgi:hypothetical protein
MIDLTRRRLLALSGNAATLGMLGGCESFVAAAAQPGLRHQRGRSALGIGARRRAAGGGRTAELPALFDDIERRTFDFFWANGNPANGMVPDRIRAMRRRASPLSGWRSRPT